MSEREIKTMPQHIKAIEGRTVTGICAVMGNVDSGGDRIIAGAFTKTLAEGSKRFRHLWHHGQDGWDYFVTPPTAKIEDIREIPRGELPDAVLAAAPEATGGLQVKRTYLETPRGNEVYEILRADVPLEMSFGYDVLLSKYPQGSESVSNNHWRDLLELKLYDTTDCNYGMNAATVASKSATERLAEVAERLARLHKDFGNKASESDLAQIEKMKGLVNNWEVKSEGDTSRAVQVIDAATLTSLMTDIDDLNLFLR